MRDDQSAHIDELVRVAVGEQSTRDAIIHESWRRCVSEHKLDPVVLRDAYIVTDGFSRPQRRDGRISSHRKISRTAASVPLASYTGAAEQVSGMWVASK